MSRYEENTGKHIIAYGLDHAVGPFVQVFTIDEPGIPFIDLDGLFCNADMNLCISVAVEWGAVNADANLRGER